MVDFDTNFNTNFNSSSPINDPNQANNPINEADLTKQMAEIEQNTSLSVKEKMEKLGKLRQEGIEQSAQLSVFSPEGQAQADRLDEITKRMNEYADMMNRIPVTRDDVDVNNADAAQKKPTSLMDLFKKNS